MTLLVQQNLFSMRRRYRTQGRNVNEGVIALRFGGPDAPPSAETTTSCLAFLPLFSAVTSPDAAAMQAILSE